MWGGGDGDNRRQDNGGGDDLLGSDRVRACVPYILPLLGE